jgi:hypothetical protein
MAVGQAWLNADRSNLSRSGRTSCIRAEAPDPGQLAIRADAEQILALDLLF